MPQGRFALGKNKKEEKIPKRYTTETPLIPLFEGEQLVALGTEPFPDLETAEKFRKVLKPSRGGRRKGSGRKKRKRKRKKKPPTADPLLVDWISENDPTKPQTNKVDPLIEGENEEEEEEDTGLFGDGDDFFF